MRTDANDFQASQKMEADVCVMGAGVAGITMANELLKKGYRVCLLEAGSDRHEPQVQDQAKANEVSSPYPDPQASRLRRLGGTSNHWANNTSPLSPIDFEKREGIPRSGWPISYQEIAPYYDKAAFYCGTGKDGYDVDFWHQKFGTTPVIKPSSSPLLQLGIAKASIPPVQFFRQHGGVLVASNDVHLITHAQVTEVDFNTASGRINSVRFDNQNGVSHTVEAREFVMAFGGIENARMLLHFNTQYANKLGNLRGNVGRYFMDHPTVRAAQLYSKEAENFSLFKGEMPSDYKRFVLNFFELSEEALREHQVTNLRLPLIKATQQQLSHGISSYHLLRERLSGKTISGDLASHITNVVMDLDIVADTVSEKLTGNHLFERAQAFGGFEIPLMMEQTPNKHNQISLSPNRDRYNIPRVNINWQLFDDDKERLWRGLDLFSQGIGAAGLGRVRSLKERASRLFSSQIGFGHHHMGTTRMSMTPEYGVVDPEQRVFGVKNLSIAGCSIFCTGGHVPPTLTIAATSIRLSEILAKRMR